MSHKYFLFISLFFLILIPTNTLKINKVIKQKSVKVLPEKFDKVYNTFKSHNANIDSALVITFCEVSKLYKLDTNESIFNLLLGQILFESGARQYSDNNLILISNTGAIGFGQVMKSTSLWYLENKITKVDSVIFNFIGASDFSFINKSYNNKIKCNLTKDWLSCETNNILMWAKIMSDNLSKTNLTKALIAYNVGNGGLHKYLRHGNNQDDHIYFNQVKSKLSYIR
jgi:hypothetical protein